MNTMEIVLLVVGGVIFVSSFFIPAGRKKDEKDRKLLQEEAKDMVIREVDGIRGRIEDIVDETVSYAVEKTERSLERVSNEKIMAVNEYSDTVLEDINKNHKEVMFLYDMLNDKQQNIKSAVSQVEKTVKAVEQTAREVGQKAKAAAVMGDQAAGMAAAVQPVTEAAALVQPATEAAAAFTALTPREMTAGEAQKSRPSAVNGAAEAVGPDISFMKEGRKKGNDNERILALHGEGKSNVAIAKELGLGVGEVKLVIDLFEDL